MTVIRSEGEAVPARAVQVQTAMATHEAWAAPVQAAVFSCGAWVDPARSAAAVCGAWAPAASAPRATTKLATAVSAVLSVAVAQAVVAASPQQSRRSPVSARPPIRPRTCSPSRLPSRTPDLEAAPESRTQWTFPRSPRMSTRWSRLGTHGAAGEALWPTRTCGSPPRREQDQSTVLVHMPSAAQQRRALRVATRRTSAGSSFAALEHEANRHAQHQVAAAWHVRLGKMRSLQATPRPGASKRLEQPDSLTCADRHTCRETLRMRQYIH